MHELLSVFGTTFLSPGISRKVLLILSNVHYESSLFSPTRSVSKCDSFTACMSLLHRINYGELYLFIHLNIPYGSAYLREWGDELFIQVSSRVWRIINCWTFVEWISEWRMKEGPFQVHEQCFQNPGEESVETSQGRVFPVRTPGTRAGFLGNSQRSSRGGIFDAEKNHSVTTSILGEEKPPMLSRCWYLKAEREVSQLPRPGGLGIKKTRNFPGWRRSFKVLTCRQSPLKMFKTDLLISASKSPISGR